MSLASTSPAWRLTEVPAVMSRWLESPVAAILARLESSFIFKWISPLEFKIAVPAKVTFALVSITISDASPVVSTKPDSNDISVWDANTIESWA